MQHIVYAIIFYIVSCKLQARCQAVVLVFLANRCYYIVHSMVNWTAAASACKTAYPGASLATISNNHEQRKCRLPQLSTCHDLPKVSSVKKETQSRLVLLSN